MLLSSLPALRSATDLPGPGVPPQALHDDVSGVAVAGRQTHMAATTTTTSAALATATTMAATMAAATMAMAAGQCVIDPLAEAVVLVDVERRQLQVQYHPRVHTTTTVCSTGRGTRALWWPAGREQ